MDDKSSSADHRGPAVGVAAIERECASAGFREAGGATDAAGEDGVGGLVDCEGAGTEGYVAAGGSAAAEGADRFAGVEVEGRRVGISQDDGAVVGNGGATGEGERAGVGVVAGEGERGAANFREVAGAADGSGVGGGGGLVDCEGVGIEGYVDLSSKTRGGAFIVILVYGSGGIRSRSGIYSRGPSATGFDYRSLRCSRKS